MMARILAAALTLIPVFKGLAHYANPLLASAARTNPWSSLQTPARADSSSILSGKERVRVIATR
jgi:hypothetical protein